MTNSSAVGINLAAVHRRLATLSRNSAVKVGPAVAEAERIPVGCGFGVVCAANPGEKRRDEEREDERPL